MRVIIQKFGGTSLASPEVRDLVVEKIKKTLQQGYQSVVVVSAMGRRGDNYATDTLIDLARSINKNISLREMDQVMYCGEMISAVVMAATLQAAGIQAVTLTGGQAGIITDATFGQARILKVDPARVVSLLKTGKTPVVCGFQGITVDGEFTTLGRGGSDTTAAALGAALNAELVEIFTDVEGIMTADPRIVHDARKLERIGYNEVCQLAHQGAKVIHPRAVEIAMQKNIPLVVKSTFSNASGTLITSASACEPMYETAVYDRVATGVTYQTGIAQLAVKPLQRETAWSSYDVFKAMADIPVSVDFINIHPDQVLFTVNEEIADKASNKLRDLGYSVNIRCNCAKVSVVGGGMREVPGVMASVAEALTVNDIPILQTVDSHTSISVLIDKSQVETAVRSLHEKFDLARC